MTNHRERPFELMRKRSGKEFSTETIRNWYIARKFVLEKLKAKEKEHPFSPDTNEYLHVVLTNDDSRMLVVARQVALSAHYINFNEEYDDETSSRRTRITIMSEDLNIKQKLSEEEYLCNLPRYCRYVVEQKVGYKIEYETVNPDSYIDIEIHIVSKSNKPVKGKNEIMLEISNDDVDEYFNRVLEGDEEVFTIDTRKAYYASRMYNIGETIDNLPAVNIHDTKRYTMALNVYQFERLTEKPQRLFDKYIMEGKQYKLKEILSNVFCSDCFNSRANAIESLNKDNLKDITVLWTKYNEALSKSEHARWVVEKLIMGYRPLNDEEHHQDEVLRAQFKSKEKLKNYHNSLKRNDEKLAHIDLCSYRDLRRINPNDLKYDSFLMLAIPGILEKVGEYNGQIVW